MDAGRPLTILLVEDDEVDVMNVKRAFKENQISNPLYIAANGIEALQILREDEGAPFVMPKNRRLILLDLNMPKMTGIEFLQELRSDFGLRGLPVVVLTTSNQDRNLMEAYNFNVAGYLVKPVSPDGFSEMVITLNHYWMLNELI